MARNILVIAAHPDDEALGCGGTLLRHCAEGDNVYLMFLTDGISARSNIDASSRNIRHAGLEKAKSYLTPATIHCENFPDNALDSVPLLNIVQAIENIAASCAPDIIYTHWPEDLNIDHAIAARATLTAFRPLPNSTVTHIYGFEVPSSTEWTVSAHAFTPNHFVDVSSYMEEKEQLLRCYADEMRPAPHARSYETLHARAIWRGHSVGLKAAEAFVTLRTLVR